MTNRRTLVELRLMIEELCCDLCRFEQTGALRCRPEQIHVYRELPLGRPDAFADIMIQPAGSAAYFVEVKFGYADEAVIESLRRKYSEKPPVDGDIDSIVLVIDRAGRKDFDKLVAKVASVLAPGLRLEVWDEERLCSMLRAHFHVEIQEIDPAKLLEVRSAIDHAKGWHAFGRGAPETYVHDPQKAQLLWNFGFWRLRQLRESAGCEIDDILKPGVCRNVAVLIADICSFSSFVRDTPNADIMHESVIAFYSKARYEILNRGGMHYQFVGDEVIGFFGLPDQPQGFLEAAYRAAVALCAIGKSVAQDWQRQIDRVQDKVGIHVGLALGDLHLLPLRPFSRTHQGFIGDTINVAARLMAQASVDEIVATNSFFQRLDPKVQAEFELSESVDAKNVGRIKAWRSRVAPGKTGR